MAIGITNCGAGGGLTMTKLWENASPASLFEGQTIYLTLTGYDMIKVVARYSNQVSGSPPCVEVKNAANTNGILMAFELTEGNNYYCTRKVTVKSNGLTFENAYAGFDGPKDENGYMLIPTTIYGLKEIK